MQREFPIVIRKNGNKLIPKFPIELEEGDQLIITKEIKGSQVPQGEKWTISGYSTSGLTITRERVPTPEEEVSHGK